MQKTLKVLSALLNYPSAEMKAAVPEMRAAIEAENVLPRQQMVGLKRILQEFETNDLFDLQERYVLLFDRTRSLSLHLFEHVHGDSRDRGQAMVDLQQLYEQHGLVFASKELPDYLPLFLEFATTIPDAEARELLSEPLHIFEAMRLRLKKRQSAYEAIFFCLQSLAKGKVSQSAVKDMMKGPDPDANDLEALDAAWEEEEVRFGPEAAQCGQDNLAEKLRAGLRPAPGIVLPEQRQTIITHSPSSRT